MDGIHDLGGMHGFGPVEVEADEPTFHERWEGRVYGMTGIGMVQALYNTSEFRHAIERMDPASYLTTSYYEHWLTALGTLLVEKGLLAEQELEGRAPSGFPRARPVLTDRAPRPPAAGEAPHFEVGERVRVRDLHPPGHTRCPRYVRGREGVIVRADRPAPLPDVEAHDDDPPEEPTYCVRFDARELWGDQAEPGTEVTVDLWRSYLEPAP
jgi:nitrile hydratase subunit beta